MCQNGVQLSSLPPSFPAFLSFFLLGMDRNAVDESKFQNF